MENNEQWLQWAVELQSIAQAGLFYSKDNYDTERYQRLRDIAAEMISRQSDFPVQKVKDIFCCEEGYQTPKIDTRAAIFKEGKILLVKENSGKWSLPGGWCDVNLSVEQNTIKEVKEEAGLDVTVKKVLAVQDREKHNQPVYAYKVCKIFLLCEEKGGQFQPNIETTQSQYFDFDQISQLELAEEKTNLEQIQMCFRANKFLFINGYWETEFD